MNNEQQNPETATPSVPIFYFGEGEKWKEISFDLLCQSKAYLKSNRKPPESRPVEAYELIEDVNGILAKYNIAYFMQPILVQANGSENVMTRREREEIPLDKTPIDTWIFNKILIQWIFAFEGSRDLKPGISCAFHEKGIDFAFGIYNRVCTNHCIFGDSWFTTYNTKRSQRKSYEDLLNALRVWLDDFENNVSIDIAMAQMMMDRLFYEQDSEDIIDTVLGALLRLAVRQNMPGTFTDAPFNITSVVKLTRGFETESIERDGIGGEKHDISLWEIYNAGTRLLKPSDTDIADIHMNNKEWGTFLLDRFIPDHKAQLPNIVEFVRKGIKGELPEPEDYENDPVLLADAMLEEEEQEDNVTERPRRRGRPPKHDKGD